MVLRGLSSDLALLLPVAVRSLERLDFGLGWLVAEPDVLRMDPEGEGDLAPAHALEPHREHRIGRDPGRQGEIDEMADLGVVLEDVLADDGGLAVTTTVSKTVPSTAVPVTLVRSPAPTRTVTGAFWMVSGACTPIVYSPGRTLVKVKAPPAVVVVWSTAPPPVGVSVTIVPIGTGRMQARYPGALVSAGSTNYR